MYIMRGEFGFQRDKIVLESLSFTYTANGKRQIQVENFSKYKKSRKKQLKTILMDKKLSETTNLCLEIMNSKRQIKGKLGHLVQIKVNMMLNLSIVGAMLMLNF